MITSGSSEDHDSEANTHELDYRALLGRATWRLLHTMAARYPEHPNELRKKRTSQFLELMSYLYPCPQCTIHMRKELKALPPRVSHTYACLP